MRKRLMTGWNMPWMVGVDGRAVIERFAREVGRVLAPEWKGPPAYLLSHRDKHNN